ncbi:hypothetical protein FRB96_008003 [Tulasnella sp. 330]|nr:hypothetical protein FRB96_008003 [Tulasnella sp. 330]KAG8881292.1 hypothetical protein FRB97_009705 [Tulasnella sp. 331]
MGCAIITLDRAYMFTDGRYFLQAAEQMDSNWTLMKQGLPDVPTWQDFLHKELPPNSRIGIDPTLIAASDAQSISSSLAANSSSTLVPLADNLVDQVWADRPTRPKTKVRALAVEFAGQSSQEKVEAVRAELKKEKADAIVVTMLDEVAWLFNLRGSDINFNPVFFAYAVITTTTSTLYIDPVQLSVVSSQPNSSASSASGKSSSFTTVISSDHLPLDLKIKPYTDIWTDLSTLGSNSTKVLVGSKASMKVLESINGDSAAGDSTASSSAAHIVSMISPTPASSTQGKSGDAAKAVGILVRSPIADLKTIKNETEIYGFRACHVRDGVALARYFAWLEEVLEKGEEVSEWNAAEVLEKYRSENELFRGLSFDTISSTGPNAAIIHYSPDPKDCAIIKQDQMYLCDSGGQYLDGTTDVTRTWHFGKPSEEERRAFTRVLQGHIAIDTAVFPQGTTGYQIDTWARRPLWQDGLDYRHGTGHGVGHFLNVHEGPQGIGMRITYNDTALKKGMTVSNEPGYYADGRFGIRIESIVIVREVSTPYNFGDKGSYLGFEHVTVSPIHTKLVNVSLMSPAEVEWLNEYHKEVWEKVSPGLKAVGDERAERWLERECKPIGLDAAR